MTKTANTKRHNRQTFLMISSDYAGKRNVADILYESSDFLQIKDVFLQVCSQLRNFSEKTHSELKNYDLIAGLDTGPYNFVADENGKIYYVDFYPPRNRISNCNIRMEDDAIITDLPQPRDETHRKHLIKYFYTGPGLWKHALAHLFACLDSNKNPNITDPDRRLKKEYELQLWAYLPEEKELCDRDNDFKDLRSRYLDHRERYYSKSRDGQARGYNISGHSFIMKKNSVYIQKYYLNGEIPFNEKSGTIMRNETERYYNILKNAGLNLPETEVTLLERDAVILGAGKGTRLGILTRQTPKMLVHINNIPMATYICRKLINSGVTSIITVIPKTFKEKISDYFNLNFSTFLKKLIPADSKGPGYALYQLKNEIINSTVPVLITPCDVICSIDYGELFNGLEIYDIVLGITDNPAIENKEYTHAKIENGLLFLEKNNSTGGKPLNGIYAVKDPALFIEVLTETIEKVEKNQIPPEKAVKEDIINTKGEYRISWIFRKLQEKGLKIGLVDCGRCFEINSSEDLDKASKMLNKY